MPGRVFVDVDTQYDFMSPDGRLYVGGAEKIVENLRRLSEFARLRKIPVIAAADAHTPDDPEFERFPPHCVHGTPGAERIPETARPEAAVIPPKGAEDAVAQFQRAGAVVLQKRDFPVFANPSADAIIDSVGDAEFVVYGVATDYCVRADVLGLLDRGKRVTVVVDAIQPIYAQAGEAALAEFRRRGAKLATTAEVCAEC